LRTNQSRLAAGQTLLPHTGAWF